LIPSFFVFFVSFVVSFHLGRLVVDDAADRDGGDGDLLGPAHARAVAHLDAVGARGQGEAHLRRRLAAAAVAAGDALHAALRPAAPPFRTPRPGPPPPPPRPAPGGGPAPGPAPPPGCPSSPADSWPSLLNTMSSTPSLFRSTRHTACVLKIRWCRPTASV